MKSALLIVDVQNDFCPDGPLAVREGDAVVPVLNRLQPEYGVVVATQDWHPADHGSFAASHPGTSPGDMIDLNGVPQILWPVHCVQGSRGAELHPRLDTTHVHAVLRKGMNVAVDSYSAFFDNARAVDLGLAAYLRGRGVTDVHVAGLATDYCVKFSALDARSEGFDVTLIADACRGVELTEGDCQQAVQQMRDAGVRVMNSIEVLP